MEFNRSDIKNVLIVILLLVCVNLGVYIYTRIDSSDGSSGSVSNADSANSPIRARRSSLVGDGNGESGHVSLHPFDPNTADSAELVGLGLQARVARAIIHYRQAGGVFRKVDDLSRIYTLSEADFQRLKPYVRIAGEYDGQSDSYSRESQTKPTQDSKQYSTQEKLKSGQHVDIALADTAQLKRIPGVGSNYAKRIVAYRDRLGGFNSLAQLDEIGLPSDLVADIKQWISLSSNTTKKQNLNNSSFSQLLRHPYLNYEQVKAIFNYRDHYGTIQSLQDLSNYDAFTAEDLARIKPYVAF